MDGPREVVGVRGAGDGVIPRGSEFGQDLPVTAHEGQRELAPMEWGEDIGKEPEVHVGDESSQGRSILGHDRSGNRIGREPELAGQTLGPEGSSRLERNLDQGAGGVRLAQGIEFRGDAARDSVRSGATPELGDDLRTGARNEVLELDVDIGGFHEFIEAVDDGLAKVDVLELETTHRGVLELLGQESTHGGQAIFGALKMALDQAQTQAGEGPLFVRSLGQRPLLQIAESPKPHSGDGGCPREEKQRRHTATEATAEEADHAPQASKDRSSPRQGLGIGSDSR